MAEITKNTVIGDILDLDETTAPYFWRWVCTASAVPLPEARLLRRHAWFTE